MLVWTPAYVDTVPPGQLASLGRCVHWPLNAKYRHCGANLALRGVSQIGTAIVFGGRIIAFQC